MIVQELDWRAPYAAFAPLAGEAHAHMLHGGDLSQTAEWSIIVAFPEKTFVADGVNAFDGLQDLIEERRERADESFKAFPFASGVVGYAGYESARFFEPSLALPVSPFTLPDVVFGVYNAAALFSRKTRRAYVVGRNEHACRRLKAALGDSSAPPEALPSFGEVTSNFTATDYQASVGGVMEEILNGDYYQANISHQLTAHADDDIAPFDLFRRIAKSSDAAFAALLQFPEGTIVSNSPERFFRISADGAWRSIVSEPIKGTRRRGQTPMQDKQYAQALIADPKDRAENIMIADLTRNDLSKICKDGSIREEAICELVSLSSVHHLVSRISGVMRDDCGFIEALEALFPCGSVTGAPKLEAMKAIARIEQVGRGPYCGAIGYLDDRGDADFSVGIRTLMISENERCVTIPVGGGVTLKSDPRQEYEETLTKARASLRAIGKMESRQA